jgi:hypothetical protein
MTRDTDTDRLLKTIEQMAHDHTLEKIALEKRLVDRKSLIRALVRQMEIDNPSFADHRCRECTHGATPDHLHKGPCAYHQAKTLLGD